MLICPTNRYQSVAVAVLFCHFDWREWLGAAAKVMAPGNAAVLNEIGGKRESAWE